MQKQILTLVLAALCCIVGFAQTDNKMCVIMKDGKIVDFSVMDIEKVVWKMGVEEPAFTNAYIHNSKPAYGYVNGNKAVEGEYSHFYDFKDVYTAFGEPSPFGGTFSQADALRYVYKYEDVAQLIAENVPFNESIDLKSIVTVCDGEGNIIDYKAHDLDLEFVKPDEFNIWNEASTVDYTNQQKCCLINDGVVTPCSALGLKYNRDAVGKRMVIQVNLRDKTDNTVIDTRYIVISIKDVEPVPQQIGVVDGVDKFNCGNNYAVEVTSTDMNNFAARFNLTSGVEFAKFYRFALPEEGDMTKLWSTDLKTVIGTVQIRRHGVDVSLADELFVTFDAEHFPLDYELYHRGTKTVTGLVKVWDVYFRYAYYVTVNMTVTFDKTQQMKYAYNKVSNYWSLGGINDPENRVVANIGMTNEQGFQAVYNLLYVYINDGASPSSAGALVSNLDVSDGDDAWFEFDNTRLSSLLSSEYSIKDLGSYQILYQGQKAIADITKGLGKVRLFEDCDYEGLVIPVVLKAQKCGYVDTIDSFVVAFKAVNKS